MFTLAVTIGRSMSYTSFGAKMEEIKTERVGMPVSNPGYLSRGLGGRGGGEAGRNRLVFVFRVAYVSTPLKTI